MKVVQINTTCGSGSTGKICVAVSELLTKQGVENYILYSSGNSKYPLGIQYMSKPETKWQALKARIWGNYGFQSQAATKRLIAELERIGPDVIHLHNLHGHNAHLGMLFTWLKEKHIKIYWTFHDCWAFTGYCPHYTMAGCGKWAEEGCRNCPQKAHYSWFFDRSSYLYKQKKKLFTGLDMTIITPSRWLADQVKQSFLREYPIKVINNGIDLSIFQPRESAFRSKHGIEDKFIVLGVAFGWGIRKGLDVFIELSKCLDSRYQIVLVGTDEKVDKLLPNNIISIHRTNNQTELAEIYTAADVFVNPTREEVLGLTNIEALACGTPVITFNTGGSPECNDETCGFVVEKSDVYSICKIVSDYKQIKKIAKENCIKRATSFDSDIKYKEYVEMIINAR